MTGFGSGSVSIDAGTIELEMKSVNSRHLKLNMRLPGGAGGWEESLKARIGMHVRRGHLDVQVRLVPLAGGTAQFAVDEERAAAYVAALRVLKAGLGLDGEVDVAALAAWDRWFTEAAPLSIQDVPLESVEEAADQALRELVDMRTREGERLEADLSSRLAAIGAALAKVAEQAPVRLETERDRLRRAVADLVPGPAMDEDRIAREIALIADRWDIDEEQVRARSHLSGMAELLAEPDAEPVGKRLGFFGQELLREINTIGSKANDADIAKLVVHMKNELESIREQIENVE
ncbi:MAG: YicC/YloC family endoribonuclease [Gemmatimonadota bacterium]